MTLPFALCTRGSGLASIVLAIACGSTPLPTEPESTPTPTLAPKIAPDLATLHVEVGGCEGGERTASTCVVRRPQKLSVWVAGEMAPRLALDGTPVSAVATAQVEGGWRNVVEVPEGVRTLQVERDGAASWSLALREAPPTPTLDRIIEALPDQNSTGRSPELKRALAEIERVLPAMSGFERVATLRLATVLAWDSGGDPIAYGRRAVAAAMEHDDATVVVTNTNLLVHMLVQGGEEAELVLDSQRMYAANAIDAVVRVRALYDVGFDALLLDEVGRGLDALEESELLARRLGLRDEELSALSMRTFHLAAYGREAERAAATERLLQRLDATKGTSCLDANMLLNVTSALVFAPGSDAVDHDPLLRRALDAFEAEGACEVGDNADLRREHFMVRTNYVDGAVARGDWDQVEARLRWFDGREIPEAARPAIDLDRAELAFARSDLPRATRLLDGIPKKTTDRVADWRAAILRGRIEHAAGRRAAAIAAYVAAEAVLDAMVDDLHADQGREGIGLGRHAGAAAAIELLVEAGKPVEAASVARRSRVRALRPVGRVARLAELDDARRAEWGEALGRYQAVRDRLTDELTGAWSLATEERERVLRGHAALRQEMHAHHRRAFAVLDQPGAHGDRLGAPPPGELWLIFHPAPTGWFVIGSSAMATRVVRIAALADAADDAALGAALLEPFAVEIADADVVEILAMGSTLDIPFHELPLGDATLLDRVAVAWSLDAGTRPPRPSATSALVVADPASRREGIGALPRSRDEGRLVADALSKQGVAVELLVGDGATAPAILQRFAHVDWFHYAGHGIAAGATGWDSAMPLAGEAELAVRDVLSSAVPRVVVLSGCSTAAVFPSTSTGGVSLATAFVLAGSDAVIGSTRDVHDAEALDMAAALYRTPHTATAAQRFRTAVLDGRARMRGWTRDLRLWMP